MFRAYEQKQKQGKEPAVSITKNGAFVLNTGCIATFFKDYDYAKLFWDAENSKVGIKPMNKKDTLSYSLSYGKNKTVGWISGKSFLKNIGIEYKGKTTSYPAVWNEKEKLVEFAVTVSSSV